MNELDALVGTFRFVTGAFALLGLGGTLYLILSGLGPALYKLGRGLAKRKIAVFAKADEQATLTSMLASSNLFSEKRVVPITSAEGLGAAEALDVFLVHWPDFKDHIDEIIRHKKDPTALIVYAPHSGGPIPIEVASQLNSKRNVTICNMRGRLMNDIVISMMTTGYEQK